MGYRRLLSHPAINGVAGSYAEHVPVICVCGSIPFKSMERGLGMHHTMANVAIALKVGSYRAGCAAPACLRPQLSRSMYQVAGAGL